MDLQHSVTVTVVALQMHNECDLVIYITCGYQSLGISRPTPTISIHKSCTKNPLSREEKGVVAHQS